MHFLSSQCFKNALAAGLCCREPRCVKELGKEKGRKRGTKSRGKDGREGQG